MATLSILPKYHVADLQLKENELENYLYNFILQRVTSVGWSTTTVPHMTEEFSYKVQYNLFIEKLKKEHPVQNVSNELKNIILDEGLTKEIRHPDNHCVIATPLMPCYAIYLLKELGEVKERVHPDQVYALVEKTLEAIDNTYQLRCPSSDSGLNSHHITLRNEAYQGLCAVTKTCSSDYLRPIVIFVTTAYRNIAKGCGFKSPITSLGQKNELKALLGYFLAEIVEFTSPSTQEMLFEFFNESILDENRPESIYKIGRSLALSMSSKTLPILLTLVKAEEDDEDDPVRENFFEGADITFTIIVDKLDKEHLEKVVETLQGEKSVDSLSKKALNKIHPTNSRT